MKSTFHIFFLSFLFASYNRYTLSFPQDIKRALTSWYFFLDKELRPASKETEDLAKEILKDCGVKEKITILETNEPYGDHTLTGGFLVVSRLINNLQRSKDAQTPSLRVKL
jgi:hypothetical protein